MLVVPSTPKEYHRINQTTPMMTGSEPFKLEEMNLDFSVLDFWRWSAADFLSNTLRGRLAEFIVAKALGVDLGHRVEWDFVDLRLSNGVGIEVKSSAFVQSWPQEKPSRPNFGIAPSRAFDSETNAYSKEVKRRADYYVFCLLAEKDRLKVDPLALDQWSFLVLSTAFLDRECPGQKSISLSALSKLTGSHSFKDLGHFEFALIS